ncbi:MAG: triose-phosphate isomerase [Dehalococcoidia bacterium]
MRIPLVAGNWKMNTTVAEARQLAEALVAALDRITGVEKVLCPPSVSLVTVKEATQGTSLKVGAQNMHYQDKGAFTGEVSPIMLQDICDYVILGHSERRHIFGEGDQFINEKVKAAQRIGLKPILCVGETLDEHEAGQTEKVLVRQTTDGLEGIGGISGLVIAYEPVWAIGTEAIGLVRRTLAELFDARSAEETRILYGGSVTPDNIEEFMRQPEIDGALVGGASLKVDDFTQIVRCASEAKGGRP